MTGTASTRRDAARVMHMDRAICSCLGQVIAFNLENWLVFHALELGIGVAVPLRMRMA